MNIITYIKNSYIKVLYFIIILSIINIVLLTSKPINAQFTDIAYMDFVLIFVSVIFLLIDYRRWKYSYKDIFDFVNNENTDEDIIYEKLPNQNYYFEVQLIKDIIRIKNVQANKKIQEVKSTLDEVNNYITKWVHEIKIPISVCEIVADKIEDIDISDQLVLEFNRIKFLINQVLYTSRASSYSEDLQVSETNLEKTIKEVIKRNSVFFISKNIDLEINNINYNVLSDQKWLSYIIDQIINNACKYVPNNGKINICAKEEEKDIKLFIKDNGIGIKVKDIKRIFDKGFTGENVRSLGKSTGMGLYLSKKIANKLNHDIFVKSAYGNGTEFTICFYKLSDYFKVT